MCYATSRRSSRTNTLFRGPRSKLVMARLLNTFCHINARDAQGLAFHTLTILISYKRSFETLQPLHRPVEVFLYGLSHAAMLYSRTLPLVAPIVDDEVPMVHHGEALADYVALDHGRAHYRLSRYAVVAIHNEVRNCGLICDIGYSVSERRSMSDLSNLYSSFPMVLSIDKAINYISEHVVSV